MGVLARTGHAVPVGWRKAVSRPLSSEDLSEIAEMLDDACQQWIAKGGKIGKTASYVSRCRCPFGAMVPEGPPQPTPTAVVGYTGMPHNFVSDFMIGFDESFRLPKTRAQMLGIGFFEKYVAHRKEPSW